MPVVLIERHQFRYVPKGTLFLVSGPIQSMGIGVYEKVSEDSATRRYGGTPFESDMFNIKWPEIGEIFKMRPEAYISIPKQDWRNE